MKRVETTAEDAPTVRLLKSFLYAGTSALLIAASHFDKSLWWLSLLGLVPFLRYVSRAHFKDAVFAGVMLAASFFVATVSASYWTAMHAILSNLAIAAAVFAAYALVVNMIYRKCGHDCIVLVALSWLPLEYALRSMGMELDVFELSRASPAIFTLVASLFGVLTVSFIVVVVNSLLLALADLVLGRKQPSERIPIVDSPVLLRISRRISWNTPVYSSICPRAPPPRSLA
jgi:apolipoprotein N-acyltransferase